VTNLRILMVGAGAVGGYFGGQLAAAGRDVTFLVREARAEVLRRDGLTIHTPDDSYTIQPTVVTREQLSEPYDLVIVTVKAFALDAAISDFAPAVGATTLVLPLLNGMRHLDALRERFGAHRVLGGCCVVAAQQQPDGSIVRLYGNPSLTYGNAGSSDAPHDGVTDARLGGISAATEPGFGDTNAALSNTNAALSATDEALSTIDAALSGAGFATHLSAHVELDMWEKWSFLASAGAATCLLRGAVGEIIAAPGGEQTVRAIIAESAAVATAAGFAPRQPSRETTEAALTKQGSPFTTSMYRDMQQGFRVEADHILGDLVARAHQFRVPVPLLTAANTSLAIYSAR
jgi:2-dehydropantoate 2-reductase